MEELPPLFAAGQRLGRYQLLRRLAVGGMAEVYLAYAVGPGDFRKVVAIKRLLPQHALDPQLLRMFLDEARLMARLSHPHVPQVTDVDDGGGGRVPYFVMEYVHGTDLRGVLNAAGGPLPLEQALAITVAVAAGLHHAHQLRGAGGQPLEIVHRDVSPSNVLISFDGAVKITDFGVAKWSEQKSFTHHGQLKGKIAHMSPEQCRGETLDRRSDIFALGTLLYEMTTGHAPFRGESEYDLLTQIVSREATAPRRPGEVYPVHLEAILMKALRRDRDQRHASTQDLQLELEAFARERRLIISPVSLAEFLESLFGAQVIEWRQALASGSNLADHLAAVGDLATVGDGDVGNEGRSALAQRRQERNPSPVARTATDTFAVQTAAPIVAAKRGAATEVAGPPATKDSGAAPQGRTATGSGERRLRGSVGIRRVVAVTASAAALALLIAATELTSRWQRGSQKRPAPPLSAATPVGGLKGDTSTAPTSGAPTSGSPTSTVPNSAAVAGPTALSVPGGAPPPPAPAVDSASSLPGPPSRRGRQTTAASARRDPGGGPAARGEPDRPSLALPSPSVAAVTPQRLVSSPDAPAVRSTEPTSSRAGSVAPTPPREQTPPPAPVKVWDPDSPVPP